MYLKVLKRILHPTKKLDELVFVPLGVSEASQGCWEEDVLEVVGEDAVDGEVVPFIEASYE